MGDVFSTHVPLLVKSFIHLSVGKLLKDQPARGVKRVLEILKLVKVGGLLNYPMNLEESPFSGNQPTFREIFDGFVECRRRSDQTV